LRLKSVSNKMSKWWSQRKELAPQHGGLFRTERVKIMKLRFVPGRAVIGTVKRYIRSPQVNTGKNTMPTKSTIASRVIPPAGLKEARQEYFERYGHYPKYDPR